MASRICPSLFNVCLLLLLPYLALGKGQLRALNEDSWQEILEGEWMVEFFAPWCPACKQLEPLWKEFAEWSDDLGIKVANIDVTINPGLSGRFVITALPTIYHVKDGVFRQYRGSRDKEAFFSFVEEKKWSNLETIPGWKSPQSFQMSSLSYFFKLSMTLRGIHNTMVEDYGIPYWGSYIVFGLATILIGAILGLMIVCVIDFICPSKPAGYQTLPKRENITSEPTQRDIGEQEFEGEDLIKDDTPEDQELRRRNQNTGTEDNS